MWHRCGTPTNHERSGTIHEFDRALESQRENNGRPKILCYFCTVPMSLDAIEADQIVPLQEFKNRVSGLGLVRSYPDKTQFPIMLFDHLLRTLDELKTDKNFSTPEVHTSVRHSATQHNELFVMIEQARQRISSHIYNTPVINSKRFERELGCEVYLKLENIQVTGSFKIRGAFNAVRCALDSGRNGGRGFVTASAGNHGLGVAYSAHRWKQEAAVFMPRSTPLTKRKAIEPYAQIHLVGETFDEAKAIALEYAKTQDLLFIHPFDDLEVVAGQGTIGLELVEDMEFTGRLPDYILVPVGGGGLITGVATVIKSKWPSVKVIGVEPINMPSLTTALRDGRPIRIQSAPTIAEGVAVAEIGHTVFPFLQDLIDDVWTVSEESIAKAIVRHMEDSRIIVEGAGACPLAALFEKSVSDPEAISNKRFLLLVSGGNIDMTAVSTLVQRGLLLARRLAHFQFTVRDRPGELAKITRSFGELQVNILDLAHSRLSQQLRLGSTFVEVIAETRDSEHQEGILTALRSKGHDVRAVSD
jgi:threonine dehydratase